MYTTYHLSELQHRLGAFDDQLAYKELFLRFQPRLKKFVYSIIHSPESAEEIASDVFIRMWEKRKTLDHIHNLRLYMYVAAKNLSINYLRRQDKFQNLQLNDLKVELESLDLDPHQLMMTGEMYRRIQQAVQDLPPKCKIIYKLVKEDGLRQKEVAELLHISPKTVENQLALAVKKVGLSISFKIDESIRLK
jgi:RNA polymerase sigma-70 factor (ECF subfamily)